MVSVALGNFGSPSWQLLAWTLNARENGFEDLVSFHGEFTVGGKYCTVIKIGRVAANLICTL
jgi:hypothetical protein